MSDYFFYGNYNQPSVAELKKMAIKSRKEAEKQGKTLEPRQNHRQKLVG